MDIYFTDKIIKMSDDLNANPKDNSEIKIIANIFSIYRYGAVKKELSKISGL